jgi:mono/diheme cytochrome c family protein
MDLMSRFRASGKAEPADPADETVINGAPYDVQKEIRNSPQNPAAPGDPPAAGIAEEIKQRQISAVVRYVAALRAR